MEQLKLKIKGLAKEYLQEIIRIRRHIHAHPELSTREFETAAYIASRLGEMGIPYREGIAETGIVALIEGKNPSCKVIALRADMDALPLFEENEVPYKSKNEGIMHACGHDAHVASLLGAAHILKTLSDNFEGTVKLFFQPSEERYPGGAIRMIKEGAMENPRPVHVFGQHVYPELEAGKIGLKSGEYMASTDEVFLTIRGKGGHAAQPMNVIDPVLIASHIIVALQQIVSRNASPDVPTVLSFGRIIGDGRTNVIPNKVIVEGTIRTFDEKWRKEAHRKISVMAQSIAEGMGGSCDVFIDSGYPFVYNDPEITLKVKNWATVFLGSENVVDIPIRMTAEDFSYFAREVPSCFYRLGVKNQEEANVPNLHTSTFDIDEKALETGMGLMAWIAINALKT